MDSTLIYFWLSRAIVLACCYRHRGGRRWLSHIPSHMPFSLPAAAAGGRLASRRAYCAGGAIAVHGSSSDCTRELLCPAGRRLAGGALAPAHKRREGRQAACLKQAK